MKVPFLDLKASYTEIKDDLDKEIDSFLKSGEYIGGSRVENFENNFAKFVEADFCVGLANGLDAIEISLKALDVGIGDEVIVPSHTFIATWLAVSNCGAVPVPVESDPKTYSIDFDKIERAITKKTKAIIPVHLYGQPVDLDPIIDLAKSYKLFVIEDAAQAHGAIYKSKKIGSHGHIVAWSFYPGKNLGGFGDGGAITTNNMNFAQKIRTIANYGSHKKYINDVIGVNSRLDPIQAIVLDIKLNHLDDWNNRRRSIAQKYLNELQGLSLILPDQFDLLNGAWHLFPVRINKRDNLVKALKNKEIDTIIHYPIPPHKQKAYSSDYKTFDLRIAEEMSTQLLSLPIGPHLTIEQVDFVIKTIKDFLVRV
jgi:dTDP-4-amino-4,6-dideoxygalactose transaminase